MQGHIESGDMHRCIGDISESYQASKSDLKDSDFVRIVSFLYSFDDNRISSIEVLLDFTLVRLIRFV